MHEDYSDEDRNSLRFVGQKIYSVQTCCLFYTTYDLQQESDTINPQMHPDIMLRSPETEEGAEAYWYARVIGIYHAKVYTTHPQVQGGGQVHRMNFLWVWWFGSEPNYNHRFREGRLPKIGFVPSTDDFAFGFLDPAHVI